MDHSITGQADRIVAGWRTGAEPVEGWDNPAGPLFAGGDYAEIDITLESDGGDPLLPVTCSACTASRPGQCC